MMDMSFLNEAPCLKPLLWLKFIPDLKLNSYIGFITKDAGKIVGVLYGSRKYFTPPGVLYLYKSIFATSGLELPDPHFLALTEFQSICIW